MISIRAIDALFCPLPCVSFSIDTDLSYSNTICLGNGLGEFTRWEADPEAFYPGVQFQVGKIDECRVAH